MGALNTQITVSKEAYEKRWDIPMNQSVQDAFNDILANFSSAEIDKSYSSEMNQFLRNDKGDVYYFDNFKYVFPRQIGDKSNIQVLNSNRGSDEFCCVRYDGESIIVENYNVSGAAKITNYFMTDETRELISRDMRGDLGNFLLQVSGDNAAYSKTLDKGSEIVVKQENGNLVSYDMNGNVLDSVPTNADSYYSQSRSGISFYRELEAKVNYRELLNTVNSLTHNPDENSGPTK